VWAPRHIFWLPRWFQLYGAPNETKTGNAMNETAQHAPPPGTSDQELVTRLSHGSTQAFEIIYHRYAAELFAYTRKNVSSREDAEEIVQDIFESFWARKDELRILALRHYLFAMARYKIVHYFRRQASQKRYEEHYRFFEASYFEPTSTDGGEDDLRARLMKCISALPVRCQEAMRLRLMENLSNPEIASRMNISKKTVEVYMYKAFTHLRDRYPDLLSS
jgi:RNA polymerase sigma-70 factor (family 1)